MCISVILDNHYGIHQPRVFCERYEDLLIDQGFEEECHMILTDDPDADEAWDLIVNNFIPEKGYHLGYFDHDQALFMIPDNYEEEL